MKKVISIISPQWGTAGTDINLLKIAEGLINEEFDVRLLIVGDEWFDKNKFKLKIIFDLGNPWIEKIIFGFTLEIKNPKKANIGTSPKI